MGKELQWTWSFTCKQPIISHPTSSRYFFSKKKKEEDIPQRIVYCVLNGLEKQALQNKQLVGQVKLWEIWISRERERFTWYKAQTRAVYMDLELFKSTKVFTFHVHPITLDSQVTTILSQILHWNFQLLCWQVIINK